MSTPLVTVCSWCVDTDIERERLISRLGHDNITHTICPDHLAQLYKPTAYERWLDCKEATRRTLTPLGWRVTQGLGLVALICIAYVVGIT